MQIVINISLLICLLCSNFSAQQNYFWKEISQLNSKNLIYIAGAKIDSLTFYDDITGGIFFLRNGKLLEYKNPYEGQFVKVIYSQISANFFIGAGIEQNYSTRFFVFKNNSFKDFELKAEAPVQKFLSLKENLVYIVGNWGTFIKYSEGRLSKINSPIKNHIYTIVADDSSNIYLGVRTEGFYKYDGKKFHKLKFEKLNYDPIDLYLDDEKIVTARIADGSTYKLSGDEFIPSEEKQRDEILKIESAFSDIIISPKNSSNKFRVSKNIRLKKIDLINDSTLLITTTEGKFFYNVSATSNYFEDYSVHYSVAGNRRDNSRGASFIDVNNDNLIDIFVLNSRDEPGNLFINNIGKPFFDLAMPLNLFSIDNIICYLFADVNNDGMDDFVAYNNNGEDKYLEISLHSTDNKFMPSSSIKNPLLRLQNLTNITFAYLNRNGSPDILLGNYYNEFVGRGFVSALSGSWYGKNWDVDTSLRPITPSWNQHLLTSDFDGNGLLDLFILNRWISNKLLLQSEKGFQISKFPSEQTDTSKLSSGAIAFDFDIDGDLDIVVANKKFLLQLFLNDGKGNFSLSRNSIFQFDTIPVISDYTIFSSHLIPADFNNDGFTDLFFSFSANKINRNILFQNFEGEKFLNRTLEYQIPQMPVNGAIAGDIDNDGDIDIYSVRNGENILLLNNLNDNNFLKLHLKGVASNRAGRHAKVWIYEAGHLNQKKYLKGYYQANSDIFNINFQNSAVIHFGLSAKNRYDIKVKFHHGREVVMLNVATNQDLTIEEYEGAAKFFLLLPDSVFRFFLNSEVQITFVTFLFALLILFFGINIGRRKYNWDFKLTSTFLVLNLSVFWIFFATTADGSFYLRHILPLIILIFGIATPHFVFYLIKKNPPNKSIEEEQRKQLLKLMLNFSHGKWASSNMNSLILLLGNYNSEDENPAIGKQLIERCESFLKNNITQLNEILALLDSGEETVQVKAEFENALTAVTQACKDFLSFKNQPEIFCKSIHHFRRLKDSISSLKQLVFAGNSADPEKVITAIIQTYDAIVRNAEISVERKILFTNHARALLPSHILADVIDNLFANAIKAMEASAKKKIEITIYKQTPKLILSFKDSGCGIPKELFDKIFEQGFSGFGSTGMGLANSKKMIENFGGRIFANPLIATGAEFIIELNDTETL